jgi:hypothetical protein
MMVSVCTLSARKWDFYDFAYRLSKQTYNQIEWVFVDYLYEINKKQVEYLSSLLNLKIIHIQNEMSAQYARNIAGNRNKALVHANGEVILFVDDFVVINEFFISHHLKSIPNTSTISCGKMYYMKEECEYEFRTLDQIMESPYDTDSRSSVLNNPIEPKIALGDEWTYTGNLCVPMEVFLKTNGFDPRLSSRGEDGDFGLRAGRLGMRIMYNPNALSINLCTKNQPVLNNMCQDAFNSIEYFKTAINDEADFYKYSKQLQNIRLDKKYNCDVLFCTVCGAEYILNPHKLVYDKLDAGELVVPKDLFNLEEERKNTCRS